MCPALSRARVGVRCRDLGSIHRRTGAFHMAMQDGRTLTAPSLNANVKSRLFNNKIGWRCRAGAVGMEAWNNIPPLHVGTEVPSCCYCGLYWESTDCARDTYI